MRSAERKEPARADRAWAEINLTNLRHNAEVLQQALPSICKLMAVVKANAYGHGAVPVALYLNRIGINSFAVATIDEGICLRKKGVEGDILILGHTSAARAPQLYRYRLSQTVSDAEYANELEQYRKAIPIHIKVDTGMHRLGESYRNIRNIVPMFHLKHLPVSGIFTHLSVSDSLEEADVAFTNRQIRNFQEVLSALKERNIPIPSTHIQSSYGVLNYPHLQCDYARIGIALYGVLSTPILTKTSLNLRPVLALKSRVVLVRTIGAGEHVGYGNSFTAQKETKIAVVSIGYADGLPRCLSNKGHVLIKGHCVPIIGRVCMDQLMVDVSSVPDVQKGDVVTLIGQDGSEKITAEQAAVDAQTITNELLSRLSDNRLKRIFLGS